MTHDANAPLRAGLSGCGGISPLTLEAAVQSTDFSVVALHDTNADAAHRLGERFGVATIVDSFDALLGDEIDFVIVNGPNHVHAEQTIAAVHAGKPVLVQKPMARNHEEALCMVDAARSAGVQLGVTMMELGRPLNVEIGKMLRDGVLGDPVLIDACLAHANYRRSPLAPDDWRLDQAKVGGGAFMQLAVHHVALSSWLLDRPVVAAGALAANGHTAFEEETTVALVRFDGGVIGSFAASWAADATRFSITGTEGRIDVCDERVCVTLNGPYTGALIDQVEPGVPYVASMKSLIAAGRDAAPALEVHGRFARALRGGEPYPWPGSRAHTDMRVLDAVARSLRSGQVEPVVTAED